MDDNWRAERFEEHRGHLRAVAYRMLDSRTEADDAVQEAWLRLSRSDTSEVENLRGWLTTVVARVCLDLLRTRASRREQGLEEAPELAANRDDERGPEHEALLADSVGLALLVVLETLAPAERVAFVLHDMFDLPFDEIARIVGRSSEASRQLASRARRRVRGTALPGAANQRRHRELVAAFLAASRSGDLGALLAVLDPGVVLRADSTAVRMGAPAEAHGAAAVAETFSKRAQAAQPATVNGEPGLVWAPGGQPRVALRFTFADGKIGAIDMVADQQRLAQLDVVPLDADHDIGSAGQQRPE
jgi:RNA polymerase sigma factor (sigma-70 family)